MEPQNKGLSAELLSLVEETGYPIIQLNGQRKFGPPPEWNAPPPQRGCEVFVGKIPRVLYEDKLVPVMSRVGKIYELRLMMDFSGSNRGYAFVTYTNKSDALRAVTELDGFEVLPGRHIGVVKSFDNCRLYVGNIPMTMTKEDIFNELSKRVACIVHVTVHQNSFDLRLNRGYAIVKFSSHRAAAMARRALVGCVKLWGQELKLDWAEPEPDIQDDEMTRIGYPAFEQQDAQKHPLLPNKLESICKRYNWATPIYEYYRYMDPAGKEVLIGSVKIPHVGLPLLQVPKSTGLLLTRACYSVKQANIEAAGIALQYLKAQANIIKRSTLQSIYKQPVQPLPDFKIIPYDYTASPSTIWGAA